MANTIKVLHSFTEDCLMETPTKVMPETPKSQRPGPRPPAAALSSRSRRPRWRRRRSPKLSAIARELKLEGINGLRKQELIAKIVEGQLKANGMIYDEGVLEILPDGFGFLRSPDYSYLPGPDDIYMSPVPDQEVRPARCDTVAGFVRPPKDGERFFALLQVKKINGIDAETIKDRPLFDNLTPLHPEREVHPRDDARGSHRASARPDLPDRQGPARPHRRPAEDRQDHHPGQDRQRDRQEPSRDGDPRPPDR